MHSLDKLLPFYVINILVQQYVILVNIVYRHWNCIDDAIGLRYWYQTADVGCRTNTRSCGAKMQAAAEFFGRTSAPPERGWGAVLANHNRQCGINFYSKMPETKQFPLVSTRIPPRKCLRPSSNVQFQMFIYQPQLANIAVTKTRLNAFSIESIATLCIQWPRYFRMLLHTYLHRFPDLPHFGVSLSPR
jgi:hypothetical protein